MEDHNQQPQEMSVDDGLELPPGFRFYPRDEEIITFYLMPKVHQRSFTCATIREIDLNRTEPWELPAKVKTGEKDLYFFYQKDRKYPTGTRMNRATKGGYWKATGRDKEIYKTTRGVVLIGMKKTLVFYKGRAPKGEKTSWIMHEYRLEGNNRLPCPASISSSTNIMKSSLASEDEWVVCRVFCKKTGVKKEPVLSPYNMAMADGGIDQSIIPMPLPLQFPMLPDFTKDMVGSYYSNTGMSSSLVPPMIPPMEGMGSTMVEPHKALFGNPNAMAPHVSSCYQMDQGTTGVDGFLAAPESRPSSMLSHMDAGMSPDQTNIIEILSMMSTAPESGPTMDMDNFWKY